MAQSRSRKEMPERAPLTGTDLYPSVNDNGRNTGESNDEMLRRVSTQKDVHGDNATGWWRNKGPAGADTNPSKPGAYQTHQGGVVHNARDDKDKVTQEIRRREARQEARRKK